MTTTQQRQEPDRSSATKRPFELGCFSEFGALHAVVVGRVDDLAYPAWSPNIRYLSGEIADLLSGAKDRKSVV